MDDLVEGLVRLMGAEGRHDPVNLGNPVEFTIRELADEVAGAVGREVRRDATGRSPRTTPPSASPTSPGPVSGSAGSRGCSSPKAW